MQFCYCTTSSDSGMGSLVIEHQLVFCVEQVGLYLSIIVGSVGVVAQVAGGAAADYMYARTNDVRWYAWVPAMTSSVATPFAIACYYATSDATSLVLFVVPTLAANCFDAPVRYYTDCLTALSILWPLLMCTMMFWRQTSALLMSMTAPNQRGAAYAFFHCG